MIIQEQIIEKELAFIIYSCYHFIDKQHNKLYYFLTNAKC
jgi:hypothetical protein